MAVQWCDGVRVLESSTCLNCRRPPSEHADTGHCPKLSWWQRIRWDVILGYEI